MVLQQGEDGMIVASCPVLPGVWTQGRTREEALANAREAIELTIEDLRAEGEDVPEEDLASVEVAV